jgi:hypothetical protein
MNVLTDVLQMKIQKVRWPCSFTSVPIWIRTKRSLSGP